MFDWNTFDGIPENTCFCNCGTIFRSHSKGMMVNGKYKLITKKACPACNTTDNCRKISSDPELFTVGEEEE